MQEVSGAYFHLACFIQIPHGFLSECPASWPGENFIQLPGLVSVSLFLSNSWWKLESQTNSSGIRSEISSAESSLDWSINVNLYYKHHCKDLSTAGPSQLCIAGRIYLLHGTGDIVRSSRWWKSLDIKILSSTSEICVLFTASRLAWYKVNAWLVCALHWTRDWKTDANVPWTCRTHCWAGLGEWVIEQWGNSY